MNRLAGATLVCCAVLLSGCGSPEDVSLESQPTPSDVVSESSSPEVKPEEPQTPTETPLPVGPSDGDLRVITGYWELYPDFARDEYCRIWRVDKVSESDRASFSGSFAESMAEPDYELIRPDEVEAFSEYWIAFLDDECL